MRIPIIRLLLGVLALTGCAPEMASQPCTGAAEGCEEADAMVEPEPEPEARGLRLTHGGIVQAAGAALDDTQTLDGALLIGGGESRSDGLRLVGALGD